jgi:hypothetical protein
MNTLHCIGLPQRARIEPKSLAHIFFARQLGFFPKNYGKSTCQIISENRNKICYSSLFLPALGHATYQQLSYPIISQNSVHSLKTANNRNYTYKSSLYRTINTPCPHNNKTARGLFLCSITQSSTQSRDTNLQQFHQPPTIKIYFPHARLFQLINLLFT